MKKLFYTLVITLLSSTTAIATEKNKQPALYTSKTLSIELASKAAWGAINACRKQGYAVAVAVLDRGGNLQALLRDRFAGPHTPETAIRKAWTANSFRQNTSVLAELLKKGKIPNQVQHNPGTLLVGGGVIIRTGGLSVGAIGVSGAPPGKTEKESLDGACGKAGIALIKDALDFSD